MHLLTAMGVVKPKNPMFGVGPITNMALDEIDNRMWNVNFNNWLEKKYRKTSAMGTDVGGYTMGEVERSMHRGLPADLIIKDMMRGIHQYFEFPETTKLAVGLGGGHMGFTIMLMHMMSAND